MNPWFMISAGWALGIGVERALPGGPILWWVWVSTGVVTFALAKVLP